MRRVRNDKLLIQNVVDISSFCHHYHPRCHHDPYHHETFCWLLALQRSSILWCWYSGTCICICIRASVFVFVFKFGHLSKMCPIWSLSSFIWDYELVNFYVFILVNLHLIYNLLHSIGSGGCEGEEEKEELVQITFLLAMLHFLLLVMSKR